MKNEQGDSVVSRIKDLKENLNYLFLFCKMNEIYGKINEQCFYIFERLYLILLNLREKTDRPICSMIIQLIITVLSYVINTLKQSKGENYELIIDPESDQFVDFLSQLYQNPEKRVGPIENIVKIECDKLDGLLIYFNSLLKKLTVMGNIGDISPSSVLRYLLAVRDFEDALIFSKFLPYLQKSLLFFFMHEYFEIFLNNKGWFKRTLSKQQTQ